jgi:hypothetical protein
MPYHGKVSRFSSRTSWDAGESSYAAAVREARASGGRLYDLTVSNPTRCGFAYDAEALLKPLADARALVYDPDPRGMVSAREAVAGYYAGRGAEVPVDDLVLATSTSESYSFLFRLLCDPGDEVLVAQPSYPLFDFLADLDDVRLRPYPLFYDHGWSIDFAELERAVTLRTRAIVVVHPNNPTGHWTGAREREALEALCARHGLALIVDEVFLDYSLNNGPLRESAAGSFACGAHPVLTFVLSGLSKIAGLPQMKAAWIATLGPDRARAGDCRGHVPLDERAGAVGHAELAGRSGGDAGADTGAGTGELSHVAANSGSGAGAAAGAGGGRRLERGGGAAGVRWGGGLCGETGARTGSGGASGRVLWDGRAEPVGGEFDWDGRGLRGRHSACHN